MKLSFRAGNAEYPFARVIRSSRCASALLAWILTWEFFVLLLKASRKPFWFDELCTLHISSLRPLSLLWSALQSGVEGMTPGYYVLVLLGNKLPGDPHVTLRLPSILGYMLTLLGVYCFTRKTLPAFAGLTAVLLITLSPFRDYAIEARSYSLMVGFLAISAVLWQKIDEKRMMMPLFALFLTLAVSCHDVAVVAISAFVLAELTWTLILRRIRWGVWAACVLATVPFFLNIPIIMHLRAITGPHFWSPAKWSVVYTTYADYAGLNWTLAVVFVVFFGTTVVDFMLRILPKLPGGPPHRLDRVPEIVLVGGFLFYPALLVIFAKVLGNSSYVPKYGWPAILGFALGSVYLLRSIWLRCSSASARLLVALLIAFSLQGYGDVRVLDSTIATRMDERWTTLMGLSRQEKTGIPVVIASPHAYLEAVEYAPPELRNRLVNVADEDIATRLLGFDTSDKVIRLLAQFIPLRVEDLGQFEAADGQTFILYSGGDGDWLTRYLVASKYRLRLLSEDAGFLVYMAERP